jgi:hypothetical protein
MSVMHLYIKEVKTRLQPNKRIGRYIRSRKDSSETSVIWYHKKKTRQTTAKALFGKAPTILKTISVLAPLASWLL